MEYNSENNAAGGERRSVKDHDTYFNLASDPCAEPVYLEPGQVLFGDRRDQMIVSTLGAGVLLSIYDVDMHIGACAYVLLPDAVVNIFPKFDESDPDFVKQAFQPIEDCIGEMKRHGAAKGRIRIRLSGGAHIQGDVDDKGTKNYILVKKYLEKKGLTVMHEDLGGSYVRRVHFFPKTGRSKRWTLRREYDFGDIREVEASFQEKVAACS